ncbi:MAG: hypothetical protein GXP29_03480 [Planctomycetes bacterium]|nr:hypothetical protein [Planctomycetota bacterium]
MQAAKRLVRDVAASALSTGRAVVIFAIVYGLLSVPWTGLQEGYSKVFRSVGHTVFHDFGPRGVVKFLPLEKPTRTTDSEITTGVKGDRRIGFSSINPRFLGYLPTIEIIALILASSISWRRRLFSFVLGLIAIHLFIYLRLLLLIRIWYSSTTPWQQYHPSETMFAFLHRVNEVINVSPTAGFVVPVLIWIAVTFRSSDWERIIRRQQHDTPLTG